MEQAARKTGWSDQWDHLRPPAPVPPAGERAGAEERTADLCGISLMHLRGDGTRLERPEGGAGCRHIILLVQLDGSCTVAHRQSTVHLSAGDLTLLDSERYFTLETSTGSSQMLGYIPFAEVMHGIPSAALPSPRRMESDDALAALAAPLMASLAQQMDRLDGEGGRCARQLLVELTRGLINRQRQRPVLVEPIPDPRVRHFIDAHLADPDLNPANIASGCNISVRRLHRIFSTTPWSACSWIRKERLERCRRDLTDPALSDLSVTQIAFRWGFNDAAHFSRAFRSAYGESPSEARRAVDAPRYADMPRAVLRGRFEESGSARP
ncbi:helix-turn-helix domain-containing protein [Sphingobium sp. DC-2]|uniref:helix-turn-helix domain-containing protein n=1 Tax=Sphingobium sp. DC-2 TaxID=1303256 RepID=UPI00069001E4|nr:helix-turn-helix domain-containing protein [Sphingobium sp. DC-2]